MKWSHLLAGTAVVLLTTLGVLKTAWVGTIPLSEKLPPLVVAKYDALSIRQLPQPRSAKITTVPKGQSLYLRCRSGKPLYFGSWLGVIDARKEKIGWVKADRVSDSEGNCPSLEALPNRVRLRPSTPSPETGVNVRFGPSTGTIPVAQVGPNSIVWTDGRYVRHRDGHYWKPVALRNGVTGWIRADLLNTTTRGLVASVAPLPQVRDPDPSATVETQEGVVVKTGGSYRPEGKTAHLQRKAAKQLENGAAAVVLAHAKHPAQVEHKDDGRIGVQVELYSAAWADEDVFLAENKEEMARSLLVGDHKLTRDVEEIHGTEAAILLRAGLLLTGGDDAARFADAVYTLSQNPEVRAQAAVLAASGADMGDLLRDAAAGKIPSEREALMSAANELSSDLSERQLPPEKVALLANQKLASHRKFSESIGHNIRSAVAEQVNALSPVQIGQPDLSTSQLRRQYFQVRQSEYSEVGELGRRVEEWSDQITDAAGEYASARRADPGGWMKSVQEKTDDYLGSTEEQAHSWRESVNSWFDSPAQTVRREPSLGEKTDQASDLIREHARDKQRKLEQKTGELRDRASDRVQDQADRAGRKAKEVKERFNDLWDD